MRLSPRPDRMKMPRTPVSISDQLNHTHATD
jgi:hypothetical protein